MTLMFTFCLQSFTSLCAIASTDLKSILRYNQYLLASVIKYIQLNTKREFHHWLFYVAEILPLLYFRMFYGWLLPMADCYRSERISQEEFSFHRTRKIICHGLAVLIIKLQLFLWKNYVWEQLGICTKYLTFIGDYMKKKCAQGSLN